jgi:hypothetical protein
LFFRIIHYFQIVDALENDEDKINMISKMNSFIHRNSKTIYQSENESEAIFGKLKNNNSLKQEIM